LKKKIVKIFKKKKKKKKKKKPLFFGCGATHRKSENEIEKATNTLWPLVFLSNFEKTRRVKITLPEEAH
jgi:hypothetical protein